MNIDYLSRLSPDLFIKQITYLPFNDVIIICQANKKLHNYCTNSQYSVRWKVLVENTFSEVHNYEEKLKQIQTNLELGKEDYNYSVYTNFVKMLDPITQLMIYYRQGDLESFEDKNNFNNTQRFLALFLLGKKEQIENYLPSPAYQPFIDLLGGKEIDKNTLNKMMIEMTKQGNIRGVEYFLTEKGADIHALNDYALRWASKNGHLEVVKYLISNNANIHANDDLALRVASENGHLEVVKYLVTNGANIHAQNDVALRLASLNGYLEVVKYLVSNGANIHANDESALRWASRNGSLEIVKYLVSNGANIHADDDYALGEASMHGHLDIVKYLVEQGANIHARNDEALRLASMKGYLEVVKYLKSQ